MVAGLVGSVVLCVGLRTLVSEQVKVRAIVRTVMIGVIAGVFLQFMDKSYLPILGLATKCGCIASSWSRSGKRIEQKFSVS
jgi:uncharacterized membrane protein